MSDPATITAPDPKVGSCKLASVLGLKPLIELYGDTVASTSSPTGSGPDIVTDPLRLFELEEAAKAAGDLGVAVRQAAQNATYTISQLVRETEGPLGIERALFVNNDYETVFNRWMREISEGADTAYRLCEEVRVAGLGISADFKDQSASHGDMLSAHDTELKKVSDGVAAYRRVIDRIKGEVENERKTIDGALEHYEKRFRTQHEASAEGVEECLKWDYPEAPALDARLKAIFARAYETKTSTGFGEAHDAAVEVVRESSALVRKYDEAYRAKRKELQDIVDRVQSAVDAHHSWIPFLGRELSEEHKTLTQGKIDAASAMADSGRNMKALKTAIVVAREAELMIDAIDDPLAKATLKATDDDISAIAHMINRHKDKRPNDAKVTQKQLDDVKSAIRGLQPNAARDKVSALKQTVLTNADPGDWQTYQGRAQLQAKWETEFTQKARELETDIAKFNSLVSGDAYSGALVAKVNALRGLVASEANQTTGTEAQALADQIEATIARYLPALSADPSDAAAADAAKELLLADQAAADAAAETLEKEKRAFEAFHAEVTRNVTAAKDNEDFKAMLDAVATARADYETCKQMLKSASTTAEKAKDYKTAHNLTEAVARDLRTLVKRSTGELFDDLQKMGRVWQIGAMDFAKKAMELELKMRAALNELDDETEKAARKIQVDQSAAAIKDLIAFYQPNAFDDVAARFASTKDVQKRKRDREEVLRRVRLYRDSVTGNPVMKAAVNNPFGVSGVAVTMYAQLKKIELMTLATL